MSIIYKCCLQKLIVTRDTCTRPQSGCRITLMNGAKQLMPFIGAKSPSVDALLKTARASVPIASATKYTKSSLDNRYSNTVKEPEYCTLVSVFAVNC